MRFGPIDKIYRLRANFINVRIRDFGLLHVVALLAKFKGTVQCFGQFLIEDSGFNELPVKEGNRTAVFLRSCLFILKESKYGIEHRIVEPVHDRPETHSRRHEHVRFLERIPGLFEAIPYQRAFPAHTQTPS